MKVVHSKDTMSDIYLDALRIRHDVFMVEQGVPKDREIDQDEANAVHFVLYNDLHLPLATVRLLPLSATAVKLQRMAVVKAARHQGIGKQLIAAVERFAQENQFKCIQLGAQLSAQPFYTTMGYQQQGDIFIDADMPHIHMYKDL